jgi:hypothetical protein
MSSGYRPVSVARLSCGGWSRRIAGSMIVSRGRFGRRCSSAPYWRGRMSDCVACGAPLPTRVGRGRPRRFCETCSPPKGAGVVNGAGTAAESWRKANPGAVSAYNARRRADYRRSPRSAEVAARRERVRALREVGLGLGAIVRVLDLPRSIVVHDLAWWKGHDGPSPRVILGVDGKVHRQAPSRGQS